VIDVNLLVSTADRERTTHDLSEHGITQALAATRTGARYRMHVANDLALQLAGSHDKVTLHPVATVNPVEYLDWQQELERVLAAGALALRFFPDLQHWSITSQAFRDMVAQVRGRCPLLIPVTEFGDASAIGDQTQHADTPVVLLGGHYTQLGDCLAALKRWPHLYLDTSRLAHFRAVENVIAEVGAQRLLFGSGAPVRPIQAALNAVLTACISNEDKHAVLNDNAARLFGLPAPPTVLPEPSSASNLIDVHAHVGALAFPTPLVSDHLSVARSHGIDCSVASSLRAIADDADAGNAECFATASEARLAYVVVDPNDLEHSASAMDTAYTRDLVVGAKLHCGWSKVPTASRACGQLLREVARRGRPLLIHVDGVEWSAALADIAASFPDWKVIVAHAGPGMPVRETADLIESTRNVYTELATSYPDQETVSEIVRRIGPDRLLFGSDLPLLDPAYVQGIYADAHAAIECTSAVAREVFGL
jgi:predicted TIM-barrel fold metal-dependent hydrolase